MFHKVSAVDVRPCWGEYQRRRRAALLAFLLFPFWIFPLSAIEYMLGSLGTDIGNIVVFLVIASVMLGFVASPYLRWILWPCPQCGRPFQLSWLGTRWFTRECVHCGLPKWELPAKMKATSAIYDEV